MTETYKLIEKLLEVAECYSDGRETYEPFEQIIREARSYLNNERSVMTEQHSITPPPELVQQWVDTLLPQSSLKAFTAAAQWGADQELEACCEWLASKVMSERKYTELRAARRPKPPSLKEQALDALAHILNNSSTQLGADTIRRALEQLDD